MKNKLILVLVRWVIYDSYVAYETAKELAEEKETKKEQKEVRKGNQWVMFHNVSPSKLRPCGGGCWRHQRRAVMTRSIRGC